MVFCAGFKAKSFNTFIQGCLNAMVKVTNLLTILPTSARRNRRESMENDWNTTGKGGDKVATKSGKRLERRILYSAGN